MRPNPSLFSPKKWDNARGPPDKRFQKNPKNLSGITWDHLVISGIFWNILEYSGICWDIFWDILGLSGVVWGYLGISGYSGYFWLMTARSGNLKNQNIFEHSNISPGMPHVLLEGPRREATQCCQGTGSNRHSDAQGGCSCASCILQLSASKASGREQGELTYPDRNKISQNDTVQQWSYRIKKTYKELKNEQLPHQRTATESKHKKRIQREPLFQNRSVCPGDAK